MTPLYGRLTGNPWRKTVTRTAHESGESRLETGSGSVRTVLHRDVSYPVFVGCKYDANNLMAEDEVEA